MIAIKNLKVNLGDFLLQNINLDIEPGEYFIVLTTSNGGFVGKVDSILGITDISERILDSQMSVSDTLSPYVMGAAKVNGKIIFIIDVEKIIEAI